MSTTLKEELMDLKSNLEQIEGELIKQLHEQELRAQNWVKLDKEVQNILSEYKDKSITLNIGGTFFKSKIETMLQIKDSLFYHIILNQNIEKLEEIFFDRDQSTFKFILSFLRYNKINIKGLSYETLENIYDDANFYGIFPLIEVLEDLRKEPIFDSFEFTSPYIYNGTHLGTNDINDINNYEDRTLKKGICCNSPGRITFTLRFPVCFSEIEYGGFNGNPNIWGYAAGNNSTIYTSLDKENWTEVGKIVSMPGTVHTLKLTQSFAKYIKVENTSYLGLGYFRVLRDVTKKD